MDPSPVQPPSVNSLSSFSNADLDQTVSRPGWVPGARSSTFKLFTVEASTPSRLWAACSMPLFSATTSSGPLACFVLLPLLLPFPARVLRLSLTLMMSGHTPSLRNMSLTCLVFFRVCMSSVTTSGRSRMSSIMCPLPATVSFRAVAASAERRASCISFLGIFLVVFLAVTGGFDCLPPTVPTANAACWPRPLRRGTRAIPCPAPSDSTLRLFPASGSLPCGWNLCDCSAMTARLITSGLSGVLKTLGFLILSVAFPSRLKTFVVSLPISSGSFSLVVLSLWGF